MRGSLGLVDGYSTIPKFLVVRRSSNEALFEYVKIHCVVLYVVCMKSQTKIYEVHLIGGGIDSNVSGGWVSVDDAKRVE